MNVYTVDWREKCKELEKQNEVLKVENEQLKNRTSFPDREEEVCQLREELHAASKRCIQMEKKYKELDVSHDKLKNAYDNELTTIAYLRGFKDGVIAVCGEAEK